MNKRLSSEKVVEVKKAIMEATDKRGNCTKSDKDLGGQLGITPWTVLFYRNKMGIESKRSARTKTFKITKEHRHPELEARLEALELKLMSKELNAI